MKLILILAALMAFAVPAMAEVADGTLYQSDAQYFDLLILSAVSYPQCVTMIYRHEQDHTLNYLAMWPANVNSDNALIATFLAAAYTSQQASWTSNRVYVVIMGEGMYSMATSDARYMANNSDARGDEWAVSYMLNHTRYDGDL